MTAATTLRTLRESLLLAINAFPTEETPKDLKPQFIALWKLKNKEDYTDPDRWSLLEDEKSGADKWGLYARFFLRELVAIALRLLIVAFGFPSYPIYSLLTYCNVKQNGGIRNCRQLRHIRFVVFPFFVENYLPSRNGMPLLVRDCCILTCIGRGRCARTDSDSSD